MSLHVQAFHHAATGSWSYLVCDTATNEAAIIDPVLGYDIETGATDTVFAQGILDVAFHEHLDVRWLLETQTHTNHLSASPWLKSQRPEATVAVSRDIRRVQRCFAATPGPHSPAFDGGQFDRLLDDGDLFRIGTLLVRVLAMPGHAADGIAYRIGDAVFAGNAVLLPDMGTARCDLPGGDAAMLYRSIRRLCALPPHTRVYVGRDTGPGGRERTHSTTIAALRQGSVHLHDGIDEPAFIAMRKALDATLEPPVLMEAALSANLRQVSVASMPAVSTAHAHPFARYLC